ncbi:GTPase-activating protein [Martiniozyma asiatica (nom. inval.)]|nr:GTPase-activating protein [Martiniozyma asiatica]
MTSPTRWLRFRKEESPILTRPTPVKALSYCGGRIFGTDITTSTKLAHGTVFISTEAHTPVVYGDVPLVIVACGSYLKQNALTTEGIFRVAGNSKRITQLQILFSTGPGYGSKINWDGYTVHDSASLLRRYLTALPEPLIPLSLYDEFRNSLMGKIHLVAYLREKDPSVQIPIRTPEERKAERKIILAERRSLLSIYAQIFDRMPEVSRRTLFYILDLLALFHLKSKENLMPAKNLAAIFQPSIINHPDHELLPEEYAINSLVLEFCITYSYKILAKVQEQDDSNISKENLTPKILSPNDIPRRTHSKSLSHVSPEFIKPVSCIETKQNEHGGNFQTDAKNNSNAVDYSPSSLNPSDETSKKNRASGVLIRGRLLSGPPRPHTVYALGQTSSSNSDVISGNNIDVNGENGNNHDRLSHTHADADKTPTEHNFKTPTDLSFENSNKKSRTPFVLPKIDIVDADLIEENNDFQESENSSIQPSLQSYSSSTPIKVDLVIPNDENNSKNKINSENKNNLHIEKVDKSGDENENSKRGWLSKFKLNL